METEKPKKNEEALLKSMEVEALQFKLLGALGALIVMGLTALGVSSDMKDQAVAEVCAGAKAQIEAESEAETDTDAALLDKPEADTSTEL